MVKLSEGKSRGVSAREGSQGDKEPARSKCGTLQEGKHAARSPYLNLAGQCWNKGKSEIMNSKYRETFVALRNKMSKYCRTTRFNLDIYKYLDRKMSEYA